MCNFEYFLFERNDGSVPVRFALSNGRMMSAQVPNRFSRMLVDKTLCLAMYAATESREAFIKIDEERFWDECRAFGVFPAATNKSSKVEDNPIQPPSPSP